MFSIIFTTVLAFIVAFVIAAIINNELDKAEEISRMEDEDYHYWWHD